MSGAPRHQHRLHWTASLWPGLPQLWGRGSWAALFVSVGFTVVACVLLAATLVYDAWIPPDARNIGFAALVLVWVLAFVESRTEWRRAALGLVSEEARLDPQERRERLFVEAQRLYLAGDWHDAENRLRKLLALDPRDPEARLMLATLCRHGERWDEASSELDELDRLEAARKWSDEIRREREAIVNGQGLLNTEGAPDNTEEDQNAPQEQGEHIIPIDGYREAA